MRETESLWRIQRLPSRIQATPAQQTDPFLIGGDQPKQASQDLQARLRDRRTAPMKKAAAFSSGPAGKITLRRAMHLSPGASESMTQLWIFVESKAHARRAEQH